MKIFAISSKTNLNSNKKTNKSSNPILPKSNNDTVTFGATEPQNAADKLTSFLNQYIGSFVRNRLPFIASEDGIARDTTEWSQTKKSKLWLNMTTKEFLYRTTNPQVNDRELERVSGKYQGDSLKFYKIKLSSEES